MNNVNVKWMNSLEVIMGVVARVALLYTRARPKSICAWTHHVMTLYLTSSRAERVWLSRARLTSACKHKLTSSTQLQKVFTPRSASVCEARNMCKISQWRSNRIQTEEHKSCVILHTTHVLQPHLSRARRGTMNWRYFGNIVSDAWSNESTAHVGE